MIMCAALYKERWEGRTKRETKVGNYNLTTNGLLYDITLSEVTRFIDVQVVASAKPVC